MSKHEADGLELPGYFLPEDSRFRLAKLKDHMEFLSRLAQPRTADEERDWAPEVRMEELAVCLELLAEQADLVLEEMSWLSSSQAMAYAAGHDGDRDEDPDAEAETEPDAEPDAGTEAEPDAGFDAMPEACNAAGKRLVYGLTVAQVDALDGLVRTISANGDVLAVGDPDDLADGTVPTLGQAIQDAAIAVREVLDQVGAQRLVPRRRPRTGVGEERSTYAVGLASPATDGPRDPMWPPQPLRVLRDAGQAGRARLH